jgi:hypothetical protein
VIVIDVHYEDLDEWDREMMLNGCGPQNSSRWYDVPDLMFTEACNRHDFDYRVGGLKNLSGGDSMLRHEADLRFLDNMYLAAEGAWWGCRWWYYLMARSYYSVVSELGRPQFVFRQPGSHITLDLLREEEEEAQVAYGTLKPSPLAACMIQSGRWVVEE